MSDQTIELLASKRFLDSYDSLHSHARSMMRRELSELRSFLSSQNGRADVKKKIATLKGFDGLSRHGYKLREWKINRSGRIVFTDGETLGLVDFSLQHEAVEALGTLKNSELLGVVESFQELPKDIALSLSDSPELAEIDTSSKPMEIASGGKDRSIIAEEYFPEWYGHVFDQKQLAVVDSLVKQISKAPSVFKEHLVIGGAGTGKTAVLLAVADRLSQEKDVKVDLRLPRMVQQMLLAHQDYKWIESLKYGVILLDDPANLSDYESAVITAKRMGVPIVTAIDPTQWRERKARKETRKIIDRSKLHKLSLQYRQGGRIGEYVFGQLSFFYSKVSGFKAGEKKSLEQEIASAWEPLCLRKIEHFDNEGNIAFLDFSQVKEDLEPGVTQYEPVKMIGKFENELLPEIKKAMDWNTDRSWPKLLIGTYTKKNLPHLMDFYLEDEDILPRSQYHLRNFTDQADVRGTEYESVLVFVSSFHWAQLTKSPPDGLGGEDWKRILNVLTFLTRAENRLIICVLPNSYAGCARRKNGENTPFDEVFRESQR